VKMPVLHKTVRERVDSIKSRTDLAAFIREMREDLLRNPELWENANLDDFLEAMSAWVDDCPGYYTNRGEAVPEQPSWKVIGDILMGAKVYS